MNGLCRIEHCGRPIVVVRDQLCQSHYTQKRKGLPFTQIMPRGKSRATADNACAFGPCEMVARAKGFCNTHYLQDYHGRPLRMTKPPVPVTTRNEDGHKWCSTCETWRPEPDFASSKGHKDGLQTRCRSCNAAIYQGRRDIVRDQMRLARLNVSREQFDTMFNAQGRACAICRTTKRGKSYWAVDHDHACCPEPGRSCGKCVRGILCGSCNAGIGYLRDNPDYLRAAARYLEAGALRSEAA